MKRDLYDLHLCADWGWHIIIRKNNPVSWSWAQRILDNNREDERTPKLNPTQKEEDDARPENQGDDGFPGEPL